MADVTLPQLGETVTEGTITQWFKQVGDTVAADEPLFEVSTDKVDTEVPSPVAGTVLEIRAAEGDTVAVGAVIAVVGDGAATDAPAAATPAPAAEPEPAPADEASHAPAGGAADAPAPSPAPPAPPPPAPPHQAPAQAPAPMTAPVDEAPEPSPAPAPATGAPATPEPATASEAPATAEQAPAAGTASPPASDQRLLSPVVRRLVNEHGIDPAQIQGTGPGGRITREDVLDHIDRNGGQGAPAAPSAPSPAPAAEPAPAAAPVPAAAPAASEARREPDAPRSTSPRSTRSVKLTKIRKLTGDHMVMSKATSPHAFSVVEIDFANVDGTRARIKQEWKSHEGFGLTYLPFISRAIVDAIAEFPHMNATVTEDELVIHDYVDLGIAVDLQYEGLLAPVVRNAETKRLRAIAREISDLASRAKARKLSPDEIQGGTFTISNNGSAGSVLTMPIINQPQVAIISTDAIVRKPVVVELPGGSEAIVVHPVGNLAMSWDHRAFDGAYAANFLQRIKHLLETRDWDAEL
jgi:pyruvate dehydrogenase E2 component (dihydrolipoamide acetyltransferase)